MADQAITCPKCNHKFQLDEALKEKLSLQLRNQFEEEFKEKAEELENKEKNIDVLVRQKFSKEKDCFLEEATKKAKEEMSLEMNDLKNELKEKNSKLKASEEKELDLLKKVREVKEKEEKIDLEIERKVEEKSKNIEDEVKRKAQEEFEKKIQEKEQQIKQMNKTIEDLKRKGEQGSMQIQGDAQEEDLKQLLSTAFLTDQIEDVPTGIRGADLIQRVQSDFGEKCGIILWESKNAKTWSDDWVRKLKKDQGETKADIAILATRIMPDGAKNIINIDGIWIAEYKLALSLAQALRTNLIQLYKMKESLTGTDEKMKYLHGYLSGPQFRNRIENIVLAFQGMQDGLEKEKRAMNKLWAKREKEIEIVVNNTTGFYGDLQGILGQSLPAVQALELPEGDIADET